MKNCTAFHEFDCARQYYRYQKKRYMNNINIYMENRQIHYLQSKRTINYSHRQNLNHFKVIKKSI
ncbi:unnamed protein product [Paramecium octaurelia]|uniref:Uncharacterized protein n=1 Tax=Paramecium octaurelia TaxID=43137 RepID=A0A8S1VC97_PAROT|nr:unnamed protein product [Paramecium octaurelia]